MNPGIVLLLVLLVLLLATLPKWPYSRRWGYAPLGGFGVLVLVVLVMLVMQWV